MGKEITVRLEGLRDAIFTTVTSKTQVVSEHAIEATNLVAALAVCMIAIASVAAVLIARTIKAPIVGMQQAMVEIAGGNLTFPIRSERKDELGVLANCIGDMVDTISEHGKMEAIMDNLDSMIAIIDLDYNLLFINEQLATRLGLDQASCVGHKCYTFLKNAERPCACCRFPALLAREVPFPSERYEIWDDQLCIWLGGTDSIIRWVDGSRVFFQSVREVTDKKQQEALLHSALEEAKTASLAKSSFLANMSHEIRTPMNAILGITEILLESETFSPNALEALDKINNSADLLLGLINDILDLSKIEAGKLELMPERYESASLINDTVQLTLTRIGSKPIEFTLDVDEALPAHLFGDPLRLKQILNNLLSNAFKYTDRGEVTLTVTVESGTPEQADVTLVFRVQDTGMGMTEAQLGKLFDEYTRFVEEANRTISGTGLGMPITRNLVHMMNGEIFVESVPGKGSVFTVRLPQGNVGAGALGKEVAENLRLFRRDQGSQHKRGHVIHEPMPYGSVLIVDDVETNLYVAKGLMRRYLLQIDTASSGVEAIDKIQGGKVYDIVFMDHMMPQMDGMEATKRIRGLGYTRPIVALTANAVVGQAEMFLANGFDGFVSKPIAMHQLNVTLNRLIRDKQPPEAREAARREHGFFQDNAEGRAGARHIDPQLAASFARDAVKAIAALAELSDTGYSDGGERLDMYILEVHAMKSALANIGEAELSDRARRLEHAGRSRDFAVIAAETPDFLGVLRTVLEKVTPQDEDEDAPGGIAEDDMMHLREKLLAIRTACAAYDISAAESALAELRQKIWPRQTRELLDVIAEHLLHSDLDEAASIAENNARMEQ
ncbi:MAG: response regulator [Deltaproteobacteria bacterium]|nr:response regulator [Deltaproteobacteria bacterium]